MQLYIIRHAQSVNNAIWAATGSGNGRLADPPLTDLGHQQARHLANHLANAKTNLSDDYADISNRSGFVLTHLYSSLMLRAVQTGHYIADTLDMPLHAWEIIHEWGGIYEDDPETGEPVGLPGPNRAFFTERFPRFLPPATLAEKGWWNRPYEPPQNTPTRAQRFLEELYARHGGADDRIGIITHGGFYQAIMRAVIGCPVPDSSPMGDNMDIWFRVNNTAVTRIDFAPDSISIVYQNRLDHLPEGSIT